MKRTMAIFGATRGLGSQLFESFHPQEKYDVIGIGSKYVNVCEKQEVDDFFSSNQPDIVVYGSAINIDGTWAKYSPDDFDDMVNTNITGFYNVLTAALQCMKDQQYGRFITLSSILSQKPLRGTGVYSACKAFMDNAVKSSALEMARHGVTVNSIQLGYHQGGLTEKVPEKVLEAAVKQIPVGRLGKGEEIARTIEWLIDSPYITGTNVSQSGGLSTC